MDGNHRVRKAINNKWSLRYYKLNIKETIKCLKFPIENEKFLI
jgi:hypothetical protein